MRVPADALLNAASSRPRLPDGLGAASMRLVSVICQRVGGCSRGAISPVVDALALTALEAFLVFETRHRLTLVIFRGRSAFRRGRRLFGGGVGRGLLA